MGKKEFKLTREGVAELERELDELKGNRKSVAEKLKTARDLGDLKENTEYHNARDEQANLESRIAEIEHILLNVQIITAPSDKSKVELGDTVVLSGKGSDRTLTIVGSVEANPAENKISNESPIGKSLLGKSKGDKVEIKLPAGVSTYSIKNIS